MLEDAGAQSQNHWIKCGAGHTPLARQENTDHYMSGTATGGAVTHVFPPVTGPSSPTHNAHRPRLGRPFEHIGARRGPSLRRQGYQLVELSLAQAAARRASWQFCLLVAPIPQVQAVAVDLVDSTWTFVTHIERRDLEVRHRIYQAQRDILRRFPALEIDFYVFDLEAPVREIESPEPPGGLVFLREPA